MSQPNPTTAPSAAPAAAPASPAASAPPAPAAAAPAPTTLNDFAELARKHIAGELPATPASEPAAPGPEPSPAPQATAPAEPTPTEPATPTEGDEPTADEMATWTEGEKRLHGALVKERAQSKEARQKVRDLETKFAELQAKLTPATPPQAAPVAPASQNAVPATTPLDDCKTFAEVDARVTQATITEATVNRLQTMLNRNGVEPVIERLKAEGIEKIGNLPLADATADDIGDFLATVYEGARMAQAQAPQRKEWLTQNQHSLAEAVKAIPELAKADSDAFKALQHAYQANPVLRSFPNWPMILVKQYLGEQALAALAKPAAAAPAAPATPPAPPAAPKKAAPGAPRTSTAAMPTPAKNDALAAKIKAGTATLAEVQEYTRSFVAA